MDAIFNKNEQEYYAKSTGTYAFCYMLANGQTYSMPWWEIM